MLEKILAIDKEWLIYLNNLGSETYDGFWLLITKQINWVPLFILLGYLIFKKLGTKNALYVLLFMVLLLTVTDQVTNLFKNGFQRLRPCNDPEVHSFIRLVQIRNSYSFFSGHAANSMAAATFLFLILRRHVKYLGFLFLWPLIFAYSRIYLGLHYPIDIICGYLFGAILGFIMFKLYQIVQKKTVSR